MAFQLLGKVTICFLLLISSLSLSAQFKSKSECITAITGFHESFNPDHLHLMLKYDEVSSIDKLEKSPYYKAIVYVLFENLLIEKINDEKSSDIGEILKGAYSDFTISGSMSLLKFKEEAYNDYLNLLKK